MIKRYIDNTYHPVVTNPFRPGDGFGNNFKFIIYSVMYAELNNCKFVYTPFIHLQHNYDDDPDYIRKKEELINFVDNFESAKDVECEPHELDVYDLLRFYQLNIEKCENSASLKKIKQLFYDNNVNHFDKSYFNVAIHIRRTNVHDFFVKSKEKEKEKDDNEILPKNHDLHKLLSLQIKNKEVQIDGLDVPDDLYLTIIEQLTSALEDRNIQFHIFSQGDMEEFSFLKARQSNIVLHLNECLEDTFRQMVFADILVTAPSTLSYTAALLSNNTIYYIEYCDPPLKSWNIVQNYKSSRKHEFIMFHNTVDEHGNILDDKVQKSSFNYDPYTNTLTPIHKKLEFRMI